VLETASNSTIEPEPEVALMTDSQRAAKLYQHLQAKKPVNIMEKLLTLYDDMF